MHTCCTPWVWCRLSQGVSHCILSPCHASLVPGLMCAQTLHCSVTYSPCIWLHESQASVLPTRMLCVVPSYFVFSFRKLYLILHCCHFTFQNLESIEIQFYTLSLALKEKKPLLDLTAELVKMPYGPLETLPVILQGTQPVYLTYL